MNRKKLTKRELPIGQFHFETLIKRECYYVDKTHFIQSLIHQGCFYFLSRPRRFGKSLLLHTMKCLFEGREELFRGLTIHKHWNWSLENRYPVLRLSFGGKYWSIEDIEDSILTKLTSIAETYNITFPADLSTKAQDRLEYTLFRLHKDTGKQVVVLIDEYDRPILGEIKNLEQATINREHLKGIYGVLKDCIEHTRFVFITGISLFSKLNLFSGLNNLYDISLDPQYAAICGYTDHDLDTVFAPELPGLDREEIQDWYNGYHWLGKDKEKVYNPHSILHLFRSRKFKNWWSLSSVPEYIYHVLTRQNITPVELMGRQTSDTLMSSFEVNSIKIDSMLFQSGYLTIVEEQYKNRKMQYRLDFPNFEIKQSLNEGFLAYIEDLDKIDVDFERDGGELIQCLAQNNFSAFKEKLSALLAKAPYPWYVHARTIHRYECWYASAVYWSFYAQNVDVSVERPTHRGRCDMVVEYADQVFVMEFKMLAGKSVEAALTEAIEQVKEKGYADSYLVQGQCVHLVALVCDENERNVSDIRTETLTLL